jgi:predicted aldo/keto reductase-like oxidoreductase
MKENKRGISRRNLLKLSVAAGTLEVAGKAPLGRAADEAPENEVAPGAADESLPQVPRRVLGKTGESVPILLMGGGMGFDRRFDPKLAEGLRFGVNYIDAADCYASGSCELSVGSFHTRADVRKDIWITSKSDQHDPGGFEKTVHESLEKMQTDYVDLYYLHALKDPSYVNDELQAVVARLKKEQKIKHFGFSCHDGNVDELLQLAAATPWIDSVMFRYNFDKYGKDDLNRAIDACVEADVGLIAMKTQRSEVSFRDAWKKFEGSGKWTKHQAVLKAVWADDRIAAAVSHMDTLDKLKQNIAAALDKTELGSVDRRALETYAAVTREHACEGCDHLCGGAVGAPVQIGATLRYVMYHDVYGEEENARRLFARLPAEARELSRVDFARANAACPRGVDVARQMERAARIFRA